MNLARDDQRDRDSRMYANTADWVWCKVCRGSGKDYPMRDYTGPGGHKVQCGDCAGTGILPIPFPDVISGLRESDAKLWAWSGRKELAR